MAYKVITPPTVEPITIDELRMHVRKDGTDEDALLLAYLSAAREHAEQFIGVAIAPQTVEVALDYFPGGGIELPGGVIDDQEPIVVSYVDENGDAQVVSPTSFALDSYSTPNWLLPAYGESWPASYSVANAVRVRYVVGGQPLSPSIRAALLLFVGHLYENREENSTAQTYALPTGVRALLTPHRVNMGV